MQITTEATQKMLANTQYFTGSFRELVSPYSEYRATK